MSEIIISDENFESEVLKSEIPVLVDFWAEWCGPCRMLAPTVEQLAEEYAGKIKVAKCNVDQCPQTASTHNVQGIPTLIVFHNGKVVSQNVGVVPKDTIKQMFASLI